MPVSGWGSMDDHPIHHKLRFYVFTYFVYSVPMSGSHPSIEDRIEALEQAVAALQDQPATSRGPMGELWVIDGLRDRDVDGVVMAGQVDGVERGPVAWQVALSADDLARRNWTEFAATIDALAHPVRLMLV